MRHMRLERLEAYRTFMIMTFPEQKDLAEVLGVKPSTYTGYIKGKRKPRSLLEMARTLGVSLDWLVGWADEPMWEPRVRLIRQSLRELARANSGPRLDYLERCTLILKEIQRKFPDLIKEKQWFLPGMLSLSQEAFQDMMNDPNADMVGEHVFYRLALYTAIPEDWFKHGNAACVESNELGEYAPFVSALASKGVSPMAAMQSLTALERHVKSKRTPG